MLLGAILHPDILRSLGTAGHGAKILIADGNYPLATRSAQTAARVYLNLAPGKVSVPDVLEAIVTCTPIEAAEVMTPDDGSEPSIFADFRNILARSTTAMPIQGGPMPLTVRNRWGFYEAARAHDVALAIATGEQRVYANVLLTIGVRDTGA
jgi:L-fucose mutarotase